jgi:hypothetical protein
VAAIGSLKGYWKKLITYACVPACSSSAKLESAVATFLFLFFSNQFGIVGG